MTDHPADRGQGFQMFGPRVGRRKQEKDQVDRPAIDRFIVDRLSQARGEAIDLRQALNLAVGNRDAVAETGRAETLPLGDAGDDGCRIQTEPLAGELGELLEQGALVGRDQIGPYRLEVEELGKLHRNALLRGRTGRWMDGSSA